MKQRLKTEQRLKTVFIPCNSPKSNCATYKAFMSVPNIHITKSFLKNNTAVFQLLMTDSILNSTDNLSEQISVINSIAGNICHECKQKQYKKHR